MIALAGKDSLFADVRSTSEALRDKLVGVEQQLFQVKVTAHGQDGVRWTATLAEKLLYLGDEVGESGDAPTEQARQVAQLLHGQLATITAEVARLLREDVAAFHNRLRRRNLHPVVTSGRP